MFLLREIKVSFFFLKKQNSIIIPNKKKHFGCRVAARSYKTATCSSYPSLRSAKLQRKLSLFLCTQSSSSSSRSLSTPCTAAASHCLSFFPGKRQLLNDPLSSSVYVLYGICRGTNAVCALGCKVGSFPRNFTTSETNRCRMLCFLIHPRVSSSDYPNPIRLYSSEYGAWDRRGIVLLRSSVCGVRFALAFLPPFPVFAARYFLFSASKRLHFYSGLAE